ncbi:lipopolysaccharide biosynthesis protein [Kushneria indalinina]|uniref:O-antigen/teichoic acid export membrane protein n=1 Tax=Kushneria indalinina DSM 14324 TaxID=1122140 RepID=A0A3D9DU27_9GAMM|nr:oligosaccharide flippase family protein [Kushneria indalinina]REC94278.1 O-antigen/teichoic acid export membrane protein [Kushneria indalinina DSM 14324]
MSRSFFSNASIYLISNIMVSSIPFLFLPLLTRLFTVEEYGQIAMFQTLVSGLSAFVGLNTVGAANRKYYDEESATDLADYLGACLQIILTSTLAIAVFFTFLGESLSNILNISVFWVFLAIVNAFSVQVINLRLGQWQVRKKAKRYALMQVSVGLANAALTVGFVVFLEWGPLGRVVGQTSAPILVAIIALFSLLSSQLVSVSYKPKLIKDALKFGVPLIPHIGGMFLLTIADRFLVNKYLGLKEAGVYMVASQLAMTMGIIFDAFNKAYVPWLYERLKRNRENEKRTIVKWTYIYCLIALCMAGLAFLVAPSAVNFLAGEKYSKASQVVGFLALGQSFQGMYHMMSTYIFYAKKTGRLAFSTIVCGSLNICLAIILIKYYGVLGAAASFPITMFLRICWVWHLAQSSFPMPWFSIFKKIK